MACMTEPPWLPVAPNTVISLVIFIVVKERLGSSEMDPDAQNLIKKSDSTISLPPQPATSDSYVSLHSHSARVVSESLT
jgi:hypothetical protein